MHASDNMDFSDGLIIKTFYNIKHLFMAVFPAFRIPLRFMVRTKPAIINTFISWFYMKITVEICKIIIMSSPDNPCKKTQKNQISILIQKEAIFRCYPNIASDLISYNPKLFIIYMNQKIGHILI